MDAQISADPPVADQSLESHARSPEEAAEPRRTEPRVRLPGEPVAEESLGGCPGAPLEQDEQLSASGPLRQPPDHDRGVDPDPIRTVRWWRRRQMLLVGAAVIGLGGAGTTAFLVSPYNRVYPVPQMASTVRHWAAEAGIKLPEPLAPAASLADVPVPPAEPVTREKYQPQKKDQQLQELLAFREPGHTPALAPDKAELGNESVTAGPAADKARMPTLARLAPDPQEGGSDRDAPPPGYVPREPGSHPSSPASPIERDVPGLRGSAGGQGSRKTHGAGSGDETPAAPAAVPRASAERPASPTEQVRGQEAHGPGSDATAAVVASLPKQSEAALSTPVVTPPPAAAADPVKTAGELRAAPLAPQDQVQVLELVTHIAAIVKDLRTQDGQLRTDFGKAIAGNAARLADFERRLALAEARHAVSAAQEAEQLPAALAGAGSTPAASASPPRPAAPVQLTRVEAEPAPVKAGGGGSDQGAIKRYRVQAASPGLALLAEIDRGGGDGAQRQVLVGETIPGYGRIKSIGQRGTTWVVETEHGNIQ